MTTFPSVTVKRGRRSYEFVPGHVWESSDPQNPLAGSLVNATAETVVVSNGRSMIHANRSELVTV